jgi:uncharacterized protein (TIGR00290 family)
MIPVALNWSSGKDAALAFWYLQHSNQYQVQTLLTTVSAAHERVSMHGTSMKILELQAQRMNIPLHKIYLPENADMEAYNDIMQAAVTQLKAAHINTFAFGDIFLEDLRQYREKQLKPAGMDVVFPLWKKDTGNLVAELEDLGIKAVIVCVNEKFLGKEFLGKRVDREFLAMLPSDVDPCGENGEFHTVVIDAPYFSSPIPVIKGETVHKVYHPAKEDPNEKWDTGFYFLDVIPA